MGSTNTGSTVLDGLVRDGEFTEVVADHLRLDFDLVEFLAAVDTNDAADHLWHDDHVSEVCLDEIGLLVGLCVLLGLAQLLDQTHRAALEASVESTAGAGMEDVDEFVGGDVEQSVDFKCQSSSNERRDCHRGKRTDRDQCLCMKTCGMFFSS